MRQIEFRGKGINDGKWYYGFVAQEIPETLETYIMPHENYNCYEIKEGISSWTLRFDNYKQVNADTIGQYTGLTDKNGNNIYENDICKFSKDKKERAEFVNYLNGSFVLGCCISLRLVQIDGYEEIQNSLEIVGNIHDNPELLEVTQCTSKL